MMPSRAPQALPEDGAAGVLSCGRCRRAYSPLAWAGLPKVRTLTPDEVHRHVIDWRDERVIEVRSCAACGGSMARMVRITR